MGRSGSSDIVHCLQANHDLGNQASALKRPYPHRTADALCSWHAKPKLTVFPFSLFDYAFYRFPLDAVTVANNMHKRSMRYTFISNFALQCLSVTLFRRDFML
jgi:hypothetical protein